MRRQKFVFVAAVVLTLVACSGPTDPGKVTPPGPISGQITIKYDRIAAGVLKCLSEGSASEEAYCKFKPSAFTGVYVNGVKWPEGSSLSVEMVKLEDGTFLATGHAPSSAIAGRLEIEVSDTWLCPGGQICTGNVSSTGKGISINGVRLADGETKTSFLYYPPQEVRK